MMIEPNSDAERFALLPPEARLARLKKMGPAALARLDRHWAHWARDTQKAPAGDWRTWLVLAGRGFGKTRMGAEWVRARAEADGRLRIALVGATLAEVRSIMIEGESGLLTIAPEEARPIWEPSLRQLTWRNGAMATAYSAAEPDSLRGPEHHIAWADEVAKWPDAERTWDMLAMTMRLGERPQVVATTTPRPVALVQRLVNATGVVRTYGTSLENRANLPAAWLQNMRGTYGGTRLGRQELDGELIEDVAGALWSRAMIEACRVEAAPSLRRVVIGVDPTASAGGDACGIVVVALGDDERAYVLADATVSGQSPEGWAQAVAAAAARWDADKVIAEGNQGGAMVESVLRAADVSLPVRVVHARHGKVARAEPVAALYEAGRAFHVGAFPALEDELCGLIIGGGYEGPGRSPDRADALVWAMSEVMLGPKAGPRVRVV
jgi:phage terminase large subunit-like protein